MTNRRISLILAAVLTGGFACSPPTSSPTPTPSIQVTVPAPPPGTQPYRLTGIVVDEAGAPVVNARVVFDYASASLYCCWVGTYTDASGRYSLNVNAREWFYPVPGVSNVIGILRAWTAAHDWQTQYVAAAAPDVVKDLRLRRKRSIDAGESIPVLVEADSSLCHDFDSDFSLTEHCETVDVTVTTGGTLTIGVQPDRPDGLIPLLEMYLESVARRAGTISHPAEAGKTYHVRVRVPTGRAPQHFVLTSSMR